VYRKYFTRVKGIEHSYCLLPTEIFRAGVLILLPIVRKNYSGGNVLEIGIKNG
tara:strand:+ start:6851 stop:7009 length:159 start_codon:yes stop_codon:yes gene_type:complete